MTKSMTGYGIVQTENESYAIYAELKTLNAKFIDLSLRLPKELSALEYQLRAVLSEGLLRGKANFTMEIIPKEGTKLSVYNSSMIKNLFAELKSATDGIALSDADLLNHVLDMPEVVQQPELSGGVLDEALTMQIVQEAIDQCDDFRKQEGSSLEKALRNGVMNIEYRLNKIREAEPSRTESIKARIAECLDEITDKVKVDENRFEQEIIYYMEKLDISEEVVRLDYHLKYFQETLDLPASQGKKLGFITQEMGREINTIGAKASDAAIQRLVVEMKDELEKIKEQVLNVL